jgi:riboflavin kinase/FMN adenylyltransferase
MDVFRGTNQLGRALREPVVAIGNFDGVHVGHQQLLDLALHRARARGGEAAVLTFDPHPAKVLAPALAPPLICTASRKQELIAERGLDVYLIEPFTRELASLSAPEFVERILRDHLHVREIVVGYDFTYGRRRQGNVETLREQGAASGITIHVVAPVTVDGLVASSTKIREFVLEGNVEGARLLLGRLFDVDGPVTRGAGRGRSIGIPTANIAATNELLPRAGVYAAHVLVLDGAQAGQRVEAVVNLGRNPTFVTGGGLSLEAHLLDFEADLYGATLRIAFHSWLRGEERFDGPQALVAQIHKDIAEARRRFATGSDGTST